MDEPTALAPLDEKRYTAARKRIAAFHTRFGDGHLYLACHAAFPMVLTPDLLYRLRANFQLDNNKQPLKILWIAIADLLLSNLCEEVEYELYEMKADVRTVLLQDLKIDPRFGLKRMKELAKFLLDYVEQQMNNEATALVQVQRWMALPYLDPTRAARELTLALQEKLRQNNRGEVLRMASLVETFADPLKEMLPEYTPLVIYAQNAVQIIRGEAQSAAVQLQAVKVLGIDLSIPEQLSQKTKVESEQPQTVRKNFFISYHKADHSWAEWIGWQLEEAGYSILFQQWDYQVNANFTFELDRATREAERIIVVLSPDYLEELATLPSWIEAFHVDPKNDPNILIALQVRECSDQLSKLLGLIVYTNLFELDEKGALEALLSRIYKESSQPRKSLEPHIEAQRLVQNQPAFPGSLPISPPPLSPVKRGRPIQVLYCYAHKDELLLNQLREYLLPLKRQGLIVDWSDHDVIIASEWEQEINSHLNSAQLILLLVSADFIASKYCYGKEMLRAIERHEAGEALVVPIILRECLWENTPFGKLQVLPTNGRPIRSWLNREDAFKDVANGIREIIEGMVATGEMDFPAHRSIVMSPPATDAHIIQQRDQIVEDVYTKLTQRSVSAIALTGISGIGKSTLAALIFRYTEMQQRLGNSPFTANPLWLGIDSTVTFADILINLCKVLNARLPNINSLSAQDQAITLFNILNNENKPRLIVFDQFENVLDNNGYAKEDRQGIGEWLDLLNSHPCACRILFTSLLEPRGTRGDPPTCLQIYSIEGLSETQGAALLRSSAEEISIQRTTASIPAVTMLLCYAHEDERIVSQLKKQLSVLEHNGLIAIWDYGSSSPGTEGEQEIEKHLDEAQIILLFISASFLASNFCYKVVMQRAIGRHERKEARVIPIILRPVYWKEPPIDKLQALPDDDKPISKWNNRAEAFENVTYGIMKVIEEGNLHGLSDPIAERKALIAHLDQLIEAVKVQMQPLARATAIVKSLQQLSIFIPFDVTLADLVVGWRTLSQSSRQEEEPAISQRRVTCGELAALASQFMTGHGDLAQAIKTWNSWRDAFKHSEDPRQAAMARTFDRELMELREAFPLLQGDARQKSETEISPAPLLLHKGSAVVLTSFEVEFLAVLAHLTNTHEEEYHGTLYERGNFVSKKWQWDVGVGQIGAGNSASAAAVERAISYFHPEIILFVGIAGGVKDVKIGDVVTVTKAYGYESGKVHETGFLPRPEVDMSSYRLIERAKAEARKKTWLRRIPGYPNLSPEEPRAFVGPIAAGEKVIASTGSDLFDFLQRTYNDTLAVEMEGHGFLEAARANEQVQALIIRGISDLLANKSASDTQGSQEMAAHHAAAFAFEVLAQYFEGE
jgi:nucleoside phosphorylase